MNGWRSIDHWDAWIKQHARNREERRFLSAITANGLGPDDALYALEAYRKQEVSAITQCECADPRCPIHEGTDCALGSDEGIRLYRIDMQDESGTWFCDLCADDALETGLFVSRVDKELNS